MLLRSLAAVLESEPFFHDSERAFNSSFQPRFLGNLLRGNQPAVKEHLRAWAIKTLSDLPQAAEAMPFEVPVTVSSDKRPFVRFEVTVSKRIPGLRAISVGGLLPADPERMTPLIYKALKEKLPKWAAADAAVRVLLLDLAICSDSENKVIRTVEKLAPAFPLFERIDYVVIADTIAFEAENYILYWVWPRGATDWSDILQPVFHSDSSQLIDQLTPLRSPLQANQG